MLLAERGLALPSAPRLRLGATPSKGGQSKLSRVLPQRHRKPRLPMMKSRVRAQPVATGLCDLLKAQTPLNSEERRCFETTDGVKTNVSANHHTDKWLILAKAKSAALEAVLCTRRCRRRWLWVSQ